MFKASFQLMGVSDLMFGRHVAEGKLDNETDDQREERVWQQKVPVDDKGHCYFNPFAITNGLVSAATWLKRKVAGERGATYTKRFRSGVNPHSKLYLFDRKDKPITIDKVVRCRLFVPSDGKHGGPKRVPRIFPTLHEWVMRGDVLIFDGKISEKIFHDHLEAMGRFIGFGAMRVENGGINGRFLIDALEWSPLEAETVSA